MSRQRNRAALLAATLALAACGGGGSGSNGGDGSVMPDPVMTMPPTDRMATEREVYWSQGAGVRSNLAHLLGPGAAGATIVALDATGAAWAKARAAAAGNAVTGSAAGAAKPAGAPRLQAVATQRRTVTGLDTFIFHNANGSAQQPLDLSARTIEAFAPDGAGGFERIAASAKRSDGTYAIAGVPEGPHWVHVGTQWVWTSAGFVDWSVDLFGREDVAFPTIATRLSINAGNLASWQDGDSLAWVVPLHGLSIALPLTDPGITNAPRLGETALGGFGLELGPNGIFDGLLDAARGDVAWLNQMLTQPASDVRVLGRSMVLAGLTTADGSTTTVSSGFVDVPASAKLRLRWNRSAFARQANAVHPGVAATSAVLGVSAFATPPLLGTPFDAYSLVEYNTLGTGDVDFGVLRYGNPFPADWNRVIDAFVGFTQNYLAPGATVSEPLLRGVSTSVLIDPGARDDAIATVAPGITPPRQPLINGKPLFDNQLAVGTNPLLSWTAPDTGAPDYYFLRVLELAADGTRSTLRQVARLITGETTITMPPDILVPGHLYVITIAAIRGGSPITQPNRNGLPFSFGTLMSGIVVP